MAYEEIGKRLPYATRGVKARTELASGIVMPRKSYRTWSVASNTGICSSSTVRTIAKNSLLSKL